MGRETGMREPHATLRRIVRSPRTRRSTRPNWSRLSVSATCHFDMRRLFSARGPRGPAVFRCGRRKHAIPWPHPAPVRSSAIADTLRPPHANDAAGGIQSRGLTRRFGDNLALAPFDLDARPGQITGLLGPNGSGKSTLLRCLTGLIRADGGSATVAGVALTGDGTAIRKRCTYSPGEVAVYGELTGNAHIDWLLRGRDATATTRARNIAEELGLPLGRRVHTYSHGMKRQLYLSCALAPDLPVRILDEITEGLDPHMRGLVLDLLVADAREGRTILLSSHHLGEVERVCDRMVFLNRGEKLAEESADDLVLRARALIQLRFEDEAGARALLECAGDDVECLRATDGMLSLRAKSGDATALIARVLSDPGAPRPLSLRAGELSLNELYQDLYGVDAC